VLDAGSRQVLRDAGVVVWLRASTAALEARVGAGDTRPLLRGGAAPALARLATDRAEVYRAVAHVTVDTSERTVEEAADAVLEAARGSDTWSA
jgi:shikimate kinase